MFDDKYQIYRLESPSIAKIYLFQIFSFLIRQNQCPKKYVVWLLGCGRKVWNIHYRSSTRSESAPMKRWEGLTEERIDWLDWNLPTCQCMWSRGYANLKSSVYMMYRRYVTFSLVLYRWTWRYARKITMNVNNTSTTSFRDACKLYEVSNTYIYSITVTSNLRDGYAVSWGWTTNFNRDTWSASNRFNPSAIPARPLGSTSTWFGYHIQLVVKKINRRTFTAVTYLNSTFLQ